MHDSPETSSAYIFDVTTDTFQEQVLDRSQQVPVVVDFWAEWCAPCRTLGPVLERVVQAFAGRVLLAKVDTDREQVLAQRYRISGIPAVKVFHKGRVVNEFVGARDQRFVANFLDGVVPSPSVEAMDSATTALAGGDAATARALLTPLLAADNPSPLPPEKRNRALLLLAQTELALQNDTAIVPLLDQIDPRSEDAERADILRQVMDFYAAACPLASRADADARLAQNGADAEAHFALAAHLARAAEWEAAFEQLLWLIENNRRFREDAGRKSLLTLFQYVAQVVGDHPAVHDARRRLQVLL